MVRRVAEAIFDLRQDYIRWPEDPQELAQEFFKVAGFPSVVGVMDGSHILVTPPKVDELSYLNRHHSHSLNILCVAGPKREVLYINTSNGGRCHDSRVLQGSSLWQLLEFEGRLPFPGAVILGDSAYQLRPWLMTPYLTNMTDDRQRYNKAHSQTRCLVEQTFGILKQRFYCLKTGLRVKDMKLAGKIITACAVMHNLCIQHGHILDEPEEEEDDHLPPPHDQLDPANQDARGEQRRSQLLLHFQRNVRR